MIPRLVARLGRGCEVGEALRECPITGLRNFVSPAMADQSCSLLLRTVFPERPVGLSRKATLGHWSVPSPALPLRRSQKLRDHAAWVHSPCLLRIGNELRFPHGCANVPNVLGAGVVTHPLTWAFYCFLCSQGGGTEGG